jgi:sugar O-acyltransferase (sialic acid O-acetyltransferase NeuD family)
MSLQDIVIFGCGGFGREVLQIIQDQNCESERWRIKGFLVSPGVETPEEVHGFRVYRALDSLGEASSTHFAIGIGSSAARLNVVRALVRSGARSFPPLVHPRAWVGRNVSMGAGVVVCAGAMVTTDIKLGEHVHLNLNVTIGHDSIIGPFGTVSPGANLSGGVRLGEGVMIGSAASVIPGVTIGDWSVIGASAAVVRDVPEKCTAVGVPAKVIRAPVT